MRVLVVEDFEVLAAAIGTGLRREGMAVDVVLDGDHRRPEPGRKPDMIGPWTSQ
jgi:DNA-binding response OmpR family regulator